jgi:hypothetical protein
VEYFHSFLTLALDGDKWSASSPGRSNPDTLCVDDWMRLRDNLGFMDYKNQILPLTGIEPRFLGRPSRSLVIILTTPFGLLNIHNITHDFVVVNNELTSSFSFAQSELGCADCHNAFGLDNHCVFFRK